MNFTRFGFIPKYYPIVQIVRNTNYFTLFYFLYEKSSRGAFSGELLYLPTVRLPEDRFGTSELQHPDGDDLVVHDAK